MYNYSKLWGRMKEKGVTLEHLSTSIGINTATLSGKLNNKSEFRQCEILAVCKCLDINVSEIEKYFFCTNTLENKSIYTA